MTRVWPQVDLACERVGALAHVHIRCDTSRQSCESGQGRAFNRWGQLYCFAQAWRLLAAAHQHPFVQFERRSSSEMIQGGMLVVAAAEP